MLDYKDLDLWKASRKLVNSIYRITKPFPSYESFGLTLQLRRCAVSIPSNIAEGIGRNHTKDTVQFLFVARGLLFELETQIYIASDQDYIMNDDLFCILDEIETCKKLLNGFIGYHQHKLKTVNSKDGV